MCIRDSNDILPFDIKMAKSQFSNTEKIEKEVQLADSGYGQGQILVNPLHMACMYSASVSYTHLDVYKRQVEPIK